MGEAARLAVSPPLKSGSGGFAPAAVVQSLGASPDGLASDPRRLESGGRAAKLLLVHLAQLSALFGLHPRLEPDLLHPPVGLGLITR